MIMAESVGHRIKIAQIPSLQLLADYPDQGILAPSVPAQNLEFGFQGLAVGIVVVAQNDETRARIDPRPQLTREPLFEIVFPIVGDAQELQIGKETGYERFQERFHGTFFKKKHHLPHSIAFRLRYDFLQQAFTPQHAGTIPGGDEVLQQRNLRCLLGRGEAVALRQEKISSKAMQLRNSGECVATKTWLPRRA